MDKEFIADVALLIPTIILFFGLPAALIFTDISGARIFGAALLLFMWCCGVSSYREELK